MTNLKIFLNLIGELLIGFFIEISPSLELKDGRILTEMVGGRGK